MNTKNLIGTYKLVKHGIFSKEGVYAPTSEHLNGELYYGADGAMHVLIVFAQNPQTAKDVYGYVGKYKVVSEQVVEHHFTVATAPNQVGTMETRDYSLKGDELRLSRKWEDGRSFEAIWKRQS